MSDRFNARTLAAKTIVAVRVGVNPTEESREARARSITLQQGQLKLHIAAKDLSAKTVEGYRYNYGQYLSSWLNRPLTERYLHALVATMVNAQADCAAATDNSVR